MVYFSPSFLIFSNMNKLLSFKIDEITFYMKIYSLKHSRFCSRSLKNFVSVHQMIFKKLKNSHLHNTQPRNIIPYERNVQNNSFFNELFRCYQRTLDHFELLNLNFLLQIGILTARIMYFFGKAQNQNFSVVLFYLF